MKTVQARLHKTGGKTSEAFHVRVPTRDGEAPDIVQRDGVLYGRDSDGTRDKPYEYFEVMWVHTLDPQGAP